MPVLHAKRIVKTMRERIHICAIIFFERVFRKNRGDSVDRALQERRVLRSRRRRESETSTIDSKSESWRFFSLSFLLALRGLAFTRCTFVSSRCDSRAVYSEIVRARMNSGNLQPHPETLRFFYVTRTYDLYSIATRRDNDLGD